MENEKASFKGYMIAFCFVLFLCLVVGMPTLNYFGKLEFLYHMEVKNLIIFTILFLIILAVMVVFLFGEYIVLVVVSVFLMAPSVGYIMIASTTDQMVERASADSSSNAVLKGPYKDLFNHKELNLTEDNLNYIHVSKYKDHMKGLLVKVNSYEKDSKEVKKIMDICEEERVSCFAKDGKTDRIYLLSEKEDFKEIKEEDYVINIF